MTMSSSAMATRGTAVVVDTPRLNRWASWTNVIVAAVIMFSTLPGRTQGLGLITEPMLRDLRLDRVTYAHINLWATLLGAAMCLPIGRLFDRAGLRRVTFGLTLLLAFVVWSMSRLTGGVFALFVLVLATRAVGQSALSVASITAVGKSFDRDVGMAMGVYSVLLSLLFAAAFSLVGGSVHDHGWRTAWAQVALGLVVLAAPTVLLLRETPRSSTAAESSTRSSEDFSLGAALRTKIFWVFGGATSLYGLAASGLGLFNEAVLAERGFDQQIYVVFLSATAVIALGGQLLCGWATLRWSMPRLLAIALLAYGAGLIMLTFVVNVAQLWVAVVLIGVSGGMTTVLFFAVWSYAFGQVHLGRIQGAAQMLTVLASATGPLIFAESAAVTGSFTPALWILAACVLGLCLAALRVKMPESITPLAR
jgi:MFS family permease